MTAGVWRPFFDEGVPDGARTFEFTGEAYEVSYSDGQRVDERYLKSIVPTTQKIEELRNGIAAKVLEGYPQSAIDADFQTMKELTDQLDGNTGPEQLLFEFRLDDRYVKFQVNDEGLTVSRFEEIRVEGEDGELLEVSRAGDTLAVTDSGAAIRLQREKLKRVTETVRAGRFLTLAGGGGIGFGADIFESGINFGVD